MIQRMYRRGCSTLMGSPSGEVQFGRVSFGVVVLFRSAGSLCSHHRYSANSPLNWTNHLDPSQ